MKTKLPIGLYYPNLICYFRAILLIYFIYIAADQPILACFVIVSSVLLDMVDGLIARVCNQSTKIGAILDYSIDRATVVGFLCILVSIYPNYRFVFALIGILDITSHLFHLNASLIHNKISHKEISNKESWLLRFYYGKRFNLTLTCLIHDLFFMLLYLYNFHSNTIILTILFILLPGVILKTAIHIAQLINSACILIQKEEDRTETIPKKTPSVVLD
jgi:phosphatidylglycerophosphate synthase